jgi:hypothetical protein
METKEGSATRYKVFFLFSFSVVVVVVVETSGRQRRE